MIDYLRYMSSNVLIKFTGNRVMANAVAITAFNADRYKWVKKAVGQFDWMEREDHTVVYLDADAD